MKIIAFIDDGLNVPLRIRLTNDDAPTKGLTTRIVASRNYSCPI